MHEANNVWNRPYVKCARVVGDVLGKISSARRCGDLRGARAHGAGFFHALHVDRRAGQFRIDRRRFGGGLSLHRVPARENHVRHAGRHRHGNGRFRAELRRQGARAGRTSHAHPESARKWVFGHRGRHGDQHSAAQFVRSGRCVPGAAQEPAVVGGRVDPDHSGARFSDARNHLRPRGGPGRLSHGARQDRDARTDAFRGDGQRRALGDHHRRASLPGQQGEPPDAHRRARAREENRRHFRYPRRIGQERNARRHRVEARRSARHHPEPAVEGDAAPGHVRDEHGRAGRRPAAAPQSQTVPRSLPPASPRSRHAPHRLRAAQSARPRAISSKVSQLRFPTSTK